jgi:hypothetical protein
MHHRLHERRQLRNLLRQALFALRAEFVAHCPLRGYGYEDTAFTHADAGPGCTLS